MEKPLGTTQHSGYKSTSLRPVVVQLQTLGTIPHLKSFQRIKPGHTKIIRAPNSSGLLSGNTGNLKDQESNAFKLLRVIIVSDLEFYIQQNYLESSIE